MLAGWGNSPIHVRRGLCGTLTQATSYPTPIRTDPRYVIAIPPLLGCLTRRFKHKSQHDSHKVYSQSMRRRQEYNNLWVLVLLAHQ